MSKETQPGTASEAASGPAMRFGAGLGHAPQPLQPESWHGARERAPARGGALRVLRGARAAAAATLALALSACGGEEDRVCFMDLHLSALSIELRWREPGAYRVEIDSDVGVGACVLSLDENTGWNEYSQCEGASRTFGLYAMRGSVRVEGSASDMPKQLSLRIRAGADAAAPLLWAETLQPEYEVGISNECDYTIGATIAVDLPHDDGEEPVRSLPSTGR